MDAIGSKTDIKLELWKDDNGCRLALSRDSEAMEFDLSYESMGKLITALDGYVSDEPHGSYKIFFFEVSDNE